MREQPNCHLLACPPEIRNLIYRHVFTFELPLTHKISEIIPNAFAFLRVCKSVEREAAPILYQLNRFVFDLDYQHRHDRRTRSFVAAKASGREPNLSGLPARHINLLRDISLRKNLLRPDQFGIDYELFSSTSPNMSKYSDADIKETINALAERATLLTSLSITWRSWNENAWDVDLSDVLSLISFGEGVSEALQQLASLRSLEIWYTRDSFRDCNDIDHEWVELDRKVLDKVKMVLFPRAMAVLSSRTVEWTKSGAYAIEDGLLIKFTR